MLKLLTILFIADGSSPGSSWLSGGFSSFRKTSEPSQIKSAAFTFGSTISKPMMPVEKQRFQPLASDSFFWFLKPDKENNTSSLSKTGTHQVKFNNYKIVPRF